MIIWNQLLWIKLYVPLILKPCLYSVVLEEDKGVQCILLYSIIPILVPNILKLHAAFYLDLIALHS